MGCCSSTPDKGAVLVDGVTVGLNAGADTVIGVGTFGMRSIITAGEVVLITGATITGGVAGAFLRGPVGAAIGASVATAAVGSIGAKTKDALGLKSLVDLDDLELDKFWRSLVNSKEVIAQLPVVGLLRIDRTGAPLPHVMIDSLMKESTNSKLFRVHPVMVKGLDYETVRSGAPLSAAQLAALDEALEELASVKAIAVTGDTGLLAHYQHICAAKTATPVLLSPLLQAPLLASVLHPKASVLCITSDSQTFGQSALESLLTSTGLADKETAERFVLRGCEKIPGFADPSASLDVGATQAALLKLVATVRDEQLKKGTPLGAILFESAMLPAFSDSLRKACRMPVCDNFTLVDFAIKSLSDNPRFGISFGPTASARKAPPAEQMPAIGILRIDYTYPPALGDAAHPNSYNYRTPHATWKGLTFEAAQEARPLSPDQREALKVALKSLEEANVMGVAGDCGFLMNYQEEARKLAKVPTFISAVLQAAVLTSLHSPEEMILVLTANGPALTPHMPRLLSQCLVTQPEQQKRFIVAGCEALPGFDAVAKGQKVDVPKVMPHVVNLVKQAVAKNPKIRAVLLECTELPPYADAIRHATRLPVLDAITIVDFFHSALDENPYWGIDWEKLASTPAAS